jgi:hypothetical protein
VVVGIASFGRRGGWDNEGNNLDATYDENIARIEGEKAVAAEPSKKRNTFAKAIDHVERRRGRAFRNIYVCDELKSVRELVVLWDNTVLIHVDGNAEPRHLETMDFGEVWELRGETKEEREARMRKMPP